MADQPLILVVDDEAAFREIFATKLGAAGFRVETAINGDEAMEKAKTLKPALVLMDVKMPGVTGADAMLKMKEDPSTRDIKVVFLTGLGDPRAEVKDAPAAAEKFSKELGAGGYLKKTDDLDSLVDRVKSFLK